MFLFCRSCGQLREATMFKNAAGDVGRSQLFWCARILTTRMLYAGPVR